MNLNDLSKQLDIFHQENREDHKAFSKALGGTKDEVEQNAKDLLERPTFEDARRIAKEQNGFRHYLASAIGGIIGAVSAFIATIFWGGR